MNKTALLSALILLLCGCTADDDTTTLMEGTISFDVATQPGTRGSVSR